MTQENATDVMNKEDLAQEVPITQVDDSTAAEESAVSPQESQEELTPTAPEPVEPTLEEQLAEMKGNYLRALAESENYRKRMAREILETREQSRIKTIGEMVGIYDLLQMAVDHASKATDVASLRQGLEMSFGEFKRILKGMGVEVLDAVGQKFDPVLHEAMSTLNSDEVPEGVVLQQWKPGFKIGEKLLRPATVVVSKGPANPPPEALEAAEVEKAEEVPVTVEK
ncbi:MAG: nucleotide exchange factor GrpE [Victivallales bacterium]|nr:nucleotide exchange factor GrpE [Victivallales bacterium]